MADAKDLRQGHEAFEAQVGGYSHNEQVREVLDGVGVMGGASSCRA